MPRYIHIKNFLSFKEAFYEFRNGATTCIMGNNLTDEGQKSNGSGKSALQNAVEFVYRGDFSRKVNKASLVRRGENSLEVEHCAFNNVRSEYLIIHRVLPKKGSEKISIYLCVDLEEFEKDRDKFKVDLPSTLESNKWIEQYVGISREDMSNYFFPNELTYKSFFDNSDTKNKELISRFSNAEIVDLAFDKISEEKGFISEKFSEKEKEILLIETKIDTRRGDLLKEKERNFNQEKKDALELIDTFILNKKNMVGKLLEEKENLNKTLKTSSKKLEVETTTLSTIQKELDSKLKSKPDFSDEFEKLEKNKKKTKSSIEEVNLILDEFSEEKEETSKEIKQVEMSLSGKITCPKCDHKFLLNEESTLEELEDKLKELNNELKDIEGDISDTNKTYEKLDKLAKNIKKQVEELDESESKFKNEFKVVSDRYDVQNRVVKKLKEEIEETKSSIHTKDLELTSNNESILIKEKEKKEVENEDFSKQSKAKEYEKEIKLLNKSLKEKEGELEEISLSLDHMDSWKNYFTSFKSFLVNKKLKIIEGMMNKFLQDMNVDYQIKLEGYKTVNNGKEVREKITPYVFKDGETYNYNEFSKGERTRMNMANLLTLQTIINETSDTGGIGLLFPDEILEGLDSEGLSMLLKSLNNTDKTVMLTTHVTDEKIYDNVLMVEKINGISKILN